MKRVVAFCTPAVERPTLPNLEALEKSIPLIEAAGWDHFYINEIGNAYISAARSNMLWKAMEKNPDAVVFLDYDVSWKPEDIVTLLETEGHVVAGTYRFKKDEEEYMGKVFVEDDGKPTVREDGCLKAAFVPAGFLKITATGLDLFAEAYPNLVYGPKLRPYLDLFNHGAHNGLWYGEDYAFCRNWREMGQDVWLLPDLDITHHAFKMNKNEVGLPSFTHKEYPGNFHKWLLQCPGGKNHKEKEHGSDLDAA